MIYAPQGTSEEGLNGFVHAFTGFIARQEVLNSLSKLVNLGLYGNSLEVEVSQDDARVRKINVDEYFRHLARYYEPKLEPAAIPHDRWDRSYNF